MAVSKRLRFEVLRRDDFTCRYCGRKAPDVELTVDHVIPVALGGLDDPENLVAACRPCNAGKSSIQPDAPQVADVKMDALRWAKAMDYAAALARTQADREDEITSKFAAEWDGWSTTDWRGDKHAIPREPGWERSVLRWVELGLDMDTLTRLIKVAMESRARADVTWRYFAGCCWNTLKARQDVAAEILRVEDEHGS